MSDLIVKSEYGLHVPLAGVYLDPVRKVDKAIISHLHADHCRFGHKRYIIPRLSEEVFKKRMGPASFTGYSFGEAFYINGLRFSFHPAGHIPGSAQIRVEHRGEVWVYSGDYKTEDDGLSTPFEPVRCHTFITECTFGLPIYRWEPQKVVFEEILKWWNSNREVGRASVLLAYSLGKAQRLIGGLDDGPGQIFCHRAVQDMTNAVRRDGFDLQKTRPLTDKLQPDELNGQLIVISPTGFSEHWSKVLVDAEKASTAGWMVARSGRKRSGADRGFVLSDHADWPGLQTAIEATGAERIICTHGFQSTLARYLCESGLRGEEL
jgi:putative mRNA 3-end processing factor